MSAPERRLAQVLAESLRRGPRARAVVAEVVAERAGEGVGERAGEGVEVGSVETFALPAGVRVEGFESGSTPGPGPGPGSPAGVRAEQRVVVGGSAPPAAVRAEQRSLETPLPTSAHPTHPGVPPFADRAD
ncbi:hypothetical protein, partial [Pseudonocardia pini]|uniref:hypothetical protein n=1 Tax=Pseudonocardia pini TaxID=2758030 RepID=UPI001C689601